MMPIMQFSMATLRVLDKEHFEAVKKAVQIREEFKGFILKLAVNTMLQIQVRQL